MVAGSFLSGDKSAQATDLPAKPKPSVNDFRYCLNTSTIREQDLGIEREIEIAGELGYDGIEPWIRQLDKYEAEGGSLSDLRKRIEDAGLTVDSAIGFARWIVDDEQERAAGLEQLKVDLDKLQQIGGTRIAAPPTGATNGPALNLLQAAERYRAILDIGQQFGIIPQLEVWGFSENLSRVGESTFVAMESGHPDACLLPDVYHIYKGGSDFNSLHMLGQKAIHVFHLNDYPANPPRDSISDKDRVFPGDGVAPLSAIFRNLHEVGFRGTFSLELFNPTYWKRDPVEVSREGLDKMKTSVQTAFEA
ncbi:Inosose isomerase [Polystyrenella longa]|uniref:Inosose isomerase n=2 Tax=Polystyrenella longa TaxID=2528007 RepID=A0A518CMD0_9PLAN|nr:Inosose isomerase [Polystyrenella longa]